MPVSLASNDEIQSFLQQHIGWTLKQKKLHREYLFKNFATAFEFMTQVAALAESSNHHPVWCNVYNKVVVDLTTHEASGITDT